MKFRKITALLLVLCMLLSLSISVFAAEADEHTIYDSAPDEEPVVSSEAATSGTIQNSGIRWSLDEKGWLTISGSGEAPVFTSVDDQPWAAVRDQITEVWFEDVETLTIPDLAYWFEGCVNLTTAELPLAPVIGKHAFYGCSKLSTITMYYGETVLKSIGEDAFWREADSGDTLYIAYIIGYSYGSWVSDSETQHKRTKTCSACGDSGYEYADHTDANGDGKCDDCGATVSLTVKWDAGTNGGTIDGKTSFSETVKSNSKPTAPGSVPVKTGYTFKGWFTAKTGGSLYSTVTITSSTTFYAQFAANKYTVTWDLGIGQSETTEQTYGEKLLLPKDPERKNAEFLGWFTEKDGGTEVDSNTIYTTDGETTYYAHWEITEVFSVTVPVTLPLIVDESGEVHAGTAEIINGSTGEVVVSSVSISTKNGWQLVPYTTDMAHEKVDAQLLGFKINGAQTTKNGNAETFALSAPWEIAENSRMTLSYDAVVSAVSKAITEQEVLSVVFVLEWRGE